MNDYIYTLRAPIDVALALLAPACPPSPNPFRQASGASGKWGKRGKRGKGASGASAVCSQLNGQVSELPFVSDALRDPSPSGSNGCDVRTPIQRYVM